MKKLTFNANGEAIDEATGKIIGTRGPDGRLVINQNTINQIENEEYKVDQKSSEQTNENTAVEQNKLQASLTADIPSPVQYSKYEVRPDSEFTIRFCIGFSDDGKVDVYKADSYLRIDGLEPHWVKFRMWTYKECLEWKNKCMEFDQQIRSFKQNNCKLNEMKIRRLIKDWSFGEVDPKFKLLHVNGVLSDESYQMMMGFYPTILDNILILMNDFLE